MTLKWILSSWTFLCSTPFWATVVVVSRCSALPAAAAKKNPPPPPPPFPTPALLNVTVTMTPTNSSLSLSLEHGRYGLESPKRPVAGLLLVPMPIDGVTNRLGCDPRTRFQVPPGTGGRWIALLERGNCTFRQKVLRAASQNVSAVVIYNNVPGVAHVTMTHQGTGEIVAVMISQQVEEILGHLEKNRTVYMSITVGSHLENKGFSPSSSYFDRSSSLLFLAIPFIILALISVAWVLFYFIRKIRHKFGRDPNQLMEMSKEEEDATLYEEYSL